MKLITKTRSYWLVMLTLVLTICLAFAFFPFQREASVKASPEVGAELVANGSFDGIADGTVLGPFDAVGGSYLGFGLLGGTGTSKHGTFVTEDGNSYFKLGGAGGGFTGQDFVLQVLNTNYVELGYGTYTVEFDVKPSASVLAKTFYFRVQGGPAEGYVQYICDLNQNATETFNERIGTDLTALDNGWYHYKKSFTMKNMDQMRDRVLWLMAGIRGATADDYFAIDNLSFKKVKELNLVKNGTFTGIENGTVLGPFDAVGGSYLGFGLLGSTGTSKHGTFVTEGGNTYFRLGGAGGGFTGQDFVLQVLNTNYVELGYGTYTVEFDVKPSASVLDKTFYFRVQGGPAEGYVQYICDLNQNATETFNEKVGTDLTALGDTGWYHYKKSFTMKNIDQMRDRVLWLMAGIRGATDDDYFAIDNLIFTKDEEMSLVKNGTFTGIADGTELDPFTPIASSYLGYGLLGDTGTSKHGTFVTEKGNSYFKLGGAGGGFTGQDFVMQILNTNYMELGFGTYTIEFDIKPSATVFDKTFYLRVQGGPKEGYVQYICDFNADAQLTFNARVGTDLTSIGDTGWYRYKKTWTMDDIEEMQERSLWLMAGIHDATADDYFAIDNLVFYKEETAPQEQDPSQLMPNGDFENIKFGDKTSLSFSQADYAAFNGGKHGEFVKDGENTVLKFGGAGGGFTKMDYVFDTGINYGKLKNGTYQMEFDIKASETVVAKTNYFRIQTGPKAAYVTYLILNRSMRVFEDAELPATDILWEDQIAVWEDLGNGWYHVTANWDVAEGYPDRTLWLMLGLTTGDTSVITATADDYYLIDNISVKKIADAEIDDGSVEIPEEDQVEIFPGFAAALNEGQTSLALGAEQNSFFAYGGQECGVIEAGTDYTGAETTVWNLKYTPACTLLNENGWNMAFGYLIDFDSLGSGYFTLSFDIKASGDVVAKTRYLRTFLNPGDKTMTYIINMNASNPTGEWEKKISNTDIDEDDTFVDLGNGWYRYSRTFVVSNARNNTDANTLVIQVGADDSVDGERTYGSANQVCNWTENDYYTFANLSLKKVRDLGEKRPSFVSDADSKGTYNVKNGGDLTINVKWNTCEPTRIKIRKASSDEYKSIGEEGVNYNYDIDNNTLTIKGSYFANFTENGEYVVQIVTLEKSLEYELTIEGIETSTPDQPNQPNQPDQPKEPTKKGCKGSVATAMGLLGLAFAGIVIARKRKED